MIGCLTHHIKNGPSYNLPCDHFVPLDLSVHNQDVLDNPYQNELLTLHSECIPNANIQFLEQF